jgi:DHA1 family bicyclomycin/chloramphenicol resistance-like MFS transporter
MKRLHLIVLAALVVAYGLGPMATQILTPAVPFVHRDFDISMAAAQTLISLAFMTIAGMTLVYGPLSDRFGRRPVILAGTALFCIGSTVAGFAPSAEILVLGRMLQAAGSAAGLTLTRTIIHDVYGRENSGQVLSYLTTAMIFVPMLSPTAGGILLDHVGWRAIFGVCVIFGLIALSLLAVRLPETIRERRCDLGLRQTAGNFRALLSDPAYMGPALFFGCVMAALFATQAAIPYLMVEVLGDSATEYGVWFGVLCAFYVAGNYISGRWGKRIGAARLIFLSGSGCLAAALAGLGAVGVLEWSAALLFVPSVVLYFCGAVAIAPVQAQAVAAQPQHAGSASGLMSAMQMVIGAAVVQAIGFTHNGTPYPMYLALIGCSTVAFLAMLNAGAAQRRANAASAASAAA